MRSRGTRRSTTFLFVRVGFAGIRKGDFGLHLVSGLRPIFPHARHGEEG